VTGVVPARIASIAGDLKARRISQTPDGIWTATLTLDGVWPIPAGRATLGKGSSCIVGSDVSISCAEVELTRRARTGAWEGGWLNPSWINDPRLPEPWRDALISTSEAERLITTEFGEGSLPMEGAPDLLLAKDGVVVWVECKRSVESFFDNECRRRVWGDSIRASQAHWISASLAAGIPGEAILSINWSRRDMSHCGQSLA
jgi:hypothetical protein